MRSVQLFIEKILKNGKQILAKTVLGTLCRVLFCK